MRPYSVCEPPSNFELHDISARNICLHFLRWALDPIILITERNRSMGPLIEINLFLDLIAHRLKFGFGQPFNTDQLISGFSDTN